MLYQETTRYKYFKIDVQDIWEYERNYYKLVEENWTVIENIYELVQEAFFKSGMAPIQEISKNPDGGTKGRLESYNDFSERKLVLDFFIRGDKLYDLNMPCPLDKTKIDPRDYAYLFALKLRQYQGDIQSASLFLDYHFKKTFKKNYKVTIKFLESALLQHKSLLMPEVLERANKWLQEKKNMLAEMVAQELKEKTEHKNFELKIVTDSVATGTEKTTVEKEPEKPANGSIVSDDIIADSKGIQDNEFDLKWPEDYDYHKGDLYDSEVQQLFSFLFLEKDEKGESYLTKEETEMIFKYGIAIPVKNRTVKYKLNFGGERSKKIIYHAIHTFYVNYSRSKRMKRIILKFFASYLEDFSQALENEDEMEKLSKNLTGEKPTKRFFQLDKYVPARVQDSFLIT